MKHAGRAAFLLFGLWLVSGCVREDAPRHENPDAAPPSIVAQPIMPQRVIEMPVDEVQATVPQLEMLMNEAPDPVIRREAVYLIADTDESEDTALVGQALYDPDSRVREAAVEALVGIGGESSANWMLVALGDPDPRIRRTAVEALGEIGGNTAKILLQQSRLDADEGVRAAAEQMLAEPGFAERELR